VETGLSSVSGNTFVLDSTTGAHHVAQNQISIKKGFSYSLQIKAKKVDADYVKLNLYNGSTSFTIFYRFSTNSFTDQNSRYTDVSAVVQDDGYVLISAVIVSDVTVNNANVAFGLSLDGNSSFTGDGTSSMDFKEVQMSESLALNLYQDSGVSPTFGTIIPRSDANNDVDALMGNPLDFKGKVRPDMKKEGSSCIELNGSSGFGNTDIIFNAAISYDVTIYLNLLQTDRTGIIFLDGRSGGNDGFVFWAYNDDLYLRHNNTDIVINTQAFSLLKTYKYRFFWNGANIKIYRNDILLSTTSETSAISVTDTFKIGARSFGTTTSFSNCKIFGLDIKLDGVQTIFPIAEGIGTTSYARDDQTKQIAWTGGATWSTQDLYHSSVNDGFTKGVNILSYSSDLTSSEHGETNMTEISATEAQIDADNANYRSSKKIYATSINAKTYNFSVTLATATGTATSKMGVQAQREDSSFLSLSSSSDITVTTTPTRHSFTSTINNSLAFGLLGRIDFDSEPAGTRVFLTDWQISESSSSLPFQKTESSPTAGAELPYTIGGVYTNPAILPNGYNGAITKGKMVAFREDLAEIVPFYNQSTFASNTINLATLPANTSDQLLLDTTDDKDRKNLIAGVPDFTGAGLALVEKYTNQ
jgi:hypothetical protein